MKYSLLVKKLELTNEKFVTRETIRIYCKELKISYYSTIGYLIANSYLIRILRGIFYVKSIEERKHKKIDLGYIEAISEAMRIKKANWYFGLESAIKFNNLTHEYFSIETIITDSFSRPRPIEIFGVKIKFIKVNKALLNFGLLGDKYKYSDIEKTILDMVYLGKYNSKSDESIKERISFLLNNVSKKKLVEYALHYPKTVERFLSIK
ncbi:MAG: hypothetical protein V1859_05810 [archaeon]